MKDYQVMPDLTEEEYTALKSDILARGVQVPIEFDTEGNCIDGHHRLKICEELGITDYPKMIRAYATEEEKFTQARALNMTRRHLSAEQRRELIRDQIKATPERSDRQIAAELGVTHPTVSKIRQEMEAAGSVGKFTTSKDTLGREQPRHHKKTISVFNPSSQETEALKDPDIIRRLSENKKLSVAEAMREQSIDNLAKDLNSPAVVAEKESRGVFDVVIVDPPYNTMSIDELKAIKIPAADNCHVFLWVNGHHIQEAFSVFKAWRIKYILTFACDRSEEEYERIKNTPIIDTAWLAIYGHIGAPKFIDEKQFFAFVDGGKDEFYKMIHRVTAGRRLEMFSTRKDEGFVHERRLYNG